MTRVLAREDRRGGRHRRAGLTLSTINQAELSKTNPTWTTVVTLAEGLGVTVAELAKAVEAERD
jgi:transcriptional regulator with XRE-family HTH domain